MARTRRKLKLKKMDKFMLAIIVLLVVASPILIVYSKSALSQSNIEVEKMKSKIEKQETVNESISMKINELASLSNIQGVAKEYGLSYNNDNIIVIK
jgi:cell division protein FtsL